MGKTMFLIFVVGVAALWSGLAPQCNAQLTGKQMKYLLQRHNDLRREVSPSASNMLEMRWDPTLARVAQEYSEKCVWEHNPRRHERFYAFGGTRRWQVGENLAIHTAKDLNFVIDASLNLFFDEHVHYNFNTLKCTPGEQCGHYTQMVWANSVAVGCGAVRCPQVSGAWAGRSAWYLTCNYGPAGNVNLHNTRPYVAGEQCSRCPASAPFCNKGLCAAEPTTEDDDVKLTMPAPVVTTQMPTTSAPTTQAPTTQTPTTKVQVTASPDSQPAKKAAVRATAHLQGRLVAAITTPGSLLKRPTIYFSSFNEGSELTGGFAVAKGGLVVPKTGLYYLYSLLWNSNIDGRLAKYDLVADEKTIAPSVSDSSSSFATSGGIFHLTAGQVVTMRLSEDAVKGRVFVWRAHNQNWMGMFEL